MTSLADALAGIRVIDLSINVPGPVASARLRDMGAHVTKIEPPSGDPLQLAAPRYYAELSAGKEVLHLDLKQPGNRAKLEDLLETADLLLTSNRPSALARLRLEWEQIHSRHARLCHVAIVGFPPPDEEAPGHDLGYQLAHGLCDPPAMPRTLLADLGGAERAVSASMALLLARERTGQARQAFVALAEAARAFAAPLAHGLTTVGGLLGGGYPPYGLYATADGWVALVALEPHFWERFVQAVGHPELATLIGGDLCDALTALFQGRSTAEWMRLAQNHDVPITPMSASTPHEQMH